MGYKIFRKINQLLPLLFLISVGSSQNLSEVIETYENGNVKKITHHKKTRNNIEMVKQEMYFENGQKEEELNFKNGKENGLFRSWFENGQMELEGAYADGMPFGKFTVWWDNGKKRAVGTAKNGKEITEQEWNRDGTVKNP